MRKFTIGLLGAIAICSNASAQLINITFRHARLDATKTHDTFDVYAGAGTGYTPDVAGSPNYATNANGSWSSIQVRFDVVIPPTVTLATGSVARNQSTTTGASFQNNVPSTATSSTMTDGGITFLNSNNQMGDLSATPILLGTVALNFTGGMISATNQLVPRANGNAFSPNNGSFWTNNASAGTQRSFSLPGTIPLPITLLSFSAIKDGGAFRSRIDWKTANEQNVSYFEVVRSSNAVDFPVVISHVKAHGNSVEEQNYLAYDNTPMTGDNWYRLRTVDLDGTVTYGAPQKVSFGNKPGVITVTPNPLSENSLLSISADQAQEAVYRVTDAEGKTVSTGTLNLTLGTNMHRLELQNLAAGTYQVNVHGPSVDGSVKVVKTQ